MKLYEFEAKNIIRNYGIDVPRSVVAVSFDEAAAAARELAKSVFIKAQITVSGRGKAGGILPAANPIEAARSASSLLGKKIKDLIVKTVLVEEKLDIKDQMYASVAIDRRARSFVILASASGGMDIEEVAGTSPDKIVRLYVNPLHELNTEDMLKTIRQLKLSEEDTAAFAHVVGILYEIALKYDAELVELNPLVKTVSGKWVAADARITLDDNALFRHPEFKERNFQREEDTAREAEARKQQFAYVDLDGDIGIIGNGAGLVMATVDTVKILGGNPANFLDIGGGAQVEEIKNGVLLVINKPEVKAILVNIFGGITRCDLVATGVVEGLKASATEKPIFVRMLGTNEKEGQEILRSHGITFYGEMEEAASAAIRKVSSLRG
jgi:succinyl-CoA synthetase beta subunit